ncbi:MAG TPA: alpha/beta hydrolase [Trinickia sp.]|uniref:alpha/beta hydrolase n=1 Tax=Trinickia sp. TaxID=2571163 RepID=UPI002C818B55|nr:alpha/beta hydrolase [Trinickia sp.]HVW51477.1 alpha/beta hydrolase [Trinickia sp.]
MSWQSAIACWLLKRHFRPETLKPHVSVERARAHASTRIRRVSVPSGWRLAVCDGAGDAPLRGEWLEPEACGSVARTMLYCHGGGYYFCSPASHRPLVFGLAARARTRTFSLDYRLAPEHPFPAALDDALAAYRRLLADGTPPESLVIAGDSAGGGLALAALVALRDAGDPLPAAGVLFSPWTDLAATGRTIESNDGRDPMFCGAAIGRAAKFYVGDADPTNPYLSPLYADFSGLPPLLIQASSTEVLLDDARRVADRASAAGVRVELEVWPELPHVWHLWTPFVPEAKRALDRAAQFVRLHACERAGQTEPGATPR